MVEFQIIICKRLNLDFKQTIAPARNALQRAPAGLLHLRRIAIQIIFGFNEFEQTIVIGFFEWNGQIAQLLHS